MSALSQSPIMLRSVNAATPTHSTILRDRQSKANLEKLSCSEYDAGDTVEWTSFNTQLAFASDRGTHLGTCLEIPYFVPSFHFGA